MEIATHRVLLGGRLVGHLHQRGDYTWLEWQQGYWDDPDRPVLGLRFEDRPTERVSSALRLPPWFANLLPEGRLRDWVARDAGVSPEREMMLLRRLGADLPGAVIVEQVTEPVDVRWHPDVVVPGPPRKPDSQSGPRFSLAGVALKFSMLRDGERLTLPLRGQLGDWIVKMPGTAYTHLPQNEFAIMECARAVGIDVPRTRLIPRDELPDLPDAVWPGGQDLAYAIERFDRTPEGDRVHIEDMAQVRGFPPDRKFDGAFESVAAHVYRGHDLPAYLEFVRRLFFSLAVGNTDMHLKNVSLIYRDPRRPTLSPTYDILCTVPYLTPDPIDTGLKLAGSRRFDRVSEVSFQRLAERVGAPVDETLRVVTEVAMRLERRRSRAAVTGAGWEQARPGMSALPEHTRFLDARIPQVSVRFR